MLEEKLIIIDDDTFKKEIDDSLVFWNHKNYLVKDVLKKNDLSVYSLSSMSNPEEKINLGDLFQFHINIKDAGSYVFFYKKEEFKKEDYLDSIMSLKEINVDSKEKALEKINKLLEILSTSKPLLTFYFESGKHSVSKDEFKDLKKLSTTIFVEREDGASSKIVFEKIFSFAKKDETKTKDSKVSIFASLKKYFPKKSSNSEKKTETSSLKDAHNVESKVAQEIKETKPVNKEKEITKKERKHLTINWKGLLIPFKFLVAEKFHFLFVLIASFLVTFTLEVGTYNVFLGKTIYFFFYACTLVGVALNSYVYYDLFNDDKDTLPMLIMSIVVSEVGLSIGLGGFAAYYNSLTDKPEYAASLGLILLIAGSVSVFAIIAGFFFGRMAIIAKIKKLEKAKIKK